MVQSYDTFLATRVVHCSGVRWGWGVGSGAKTGFFELTGPQIKHFRRTWAHLQNDGKL